ncbi:hypothetical protein [Nocardia sp. NPDC050793]|uniref:hypothetical protein n=1 Tax=Nocardia sp. NPDC050793 TaxID=3155159 RepID=UPI0033F3094A
MDTSWKASADPAQRRRAKAQLTAVSVAVATVMRGRQTLDRRAGAAVPDLT